MFRSTLRKRSIIYRQNVQFYVRNFSNNKEHNIKFYINNKEHIVDMNKCNLDADTTTLLQYLRDNNLTGTKLVCGEGGCGACCIAVKNPWRTINSCLFPLASANNHHFFTVESIGNTSIGLHRVQKILTDCFGSQCGYCTPGITTQLWTELQKNPNSGYDELMAALHGSLCRCTGYRSICAAVQQIADENQAIINENNNNNKVDIIDNDNSIEIVTKNSKWYSPKTLDELLELKYKYPNAKVVAGNTEVGIEQRFMHQYHNELIHIRHNIPELHNIILDNGKNEMVFGASVPLEEIMNLAIKHDNDIKYRGLYAIRKQLELFAGPSIRSVATMGGNIMNASPISDLNPLFVAFNATFTLASHNKPLRHIKAVDFFIDYRKVAAESHETLINIAIPHCNENTYQMSFKQSRRREDDIAIVNAGMSVQLNNKNIIENGTLCFGGMGRTVVTKTLNFVNGKQWNNETYDIIISKLAKELILPKDVPGGMPDYRTSLCLSFFKKFFHYINDKNSDSYIPLSCPAQKGTPKYPHIVTPNDIVGQSYGHSSGERQVSGEAIYIDDLPSTEQELKACIVPSMIPHGRFKSKTNLNNLKSIIKKEFSDIYEIYTYENIPGSNIIGDIIHDEIVLAEDEVTWVGQPIAIILAKNDTIARKAAVKMAKMIEYDELPSIMTIDDAIKEESFFDDYDHKIECGNVDDAMLKADHIINGEIYIGGQEHFYLEPHTCLAIPEDTEMTIYSSTQNLNKTQLTISSVLNIPAHKIPCSVRRIGGGFGGKETSSIHFACLAAIGAYNSKRPVRLVLGRDEDFKYSGKRHPFKGIYKYGVMNDGTIIAGDVLLYSNGGYSHDLSQPVTDRALFHIDNAYKIPNFRVKGKICRTNQVTNTAFRGFGGPQGMFVVESAFEKIAKKLNILPHELRTKNLYKINDTTHYGQKVIEDLSRLWQQGLNSGPGINKLINDCNEFNKQHKYKKRGVGIVPAKFGLSFTATFLNQGDALVHIYTDGSVLVNHGGVEMGQGLHTKVQQIAAHTLNIPMEQVYISETNSSKIPNASATAASMGSDIYGAAVLKACETLYSRLKPYRDAQPNGTFKDWVTSAYFDRTSLSAQGYIKIPVGGYNFDTGKGDPFLYYTCGVAASQVEIDTLTGDHRVLHTEIVMDVGNSINPMIDIGQIEGAFVQGQGWLTMEELVWGDSTHKWMKRGHLFTAGPGAYKIPSADDIPREFNVSLFPNSPNIKAVHSSRGIGEPPILLSYSVISGLRQAIFAARKEQNVDNDFDLMLPLTCERIRMLCCDDITLKVVENSNKKSEVKWDNYQSYGSV